MNQQDILLRELENNRQPQLDQQENDWAAFSTMLAGPEPEQTPKPKRGKLRRLFSITIGTIIIGVGSFFIAKKMKKNPHELQEQNSTLAANPYKPMLDSADVPYETFIIDNQLGDTIVTKNGSLVMFPKNSMLDGIGNIVQGKVQVTSREFNDPIDIALSGIPMTYDSAGIAYNFISSGMIDIQANQNGKALLVNPEAKPTIHMVSTTDEATNLYRFDNGANKWINKGSVERTDLRKKNAKDTTAKKPKPANTTKYTKPTSAGMFRNEMTISPPRKASGKKPVIEIIIDTTSFWELKAYNNLKFEIIGGDAWNEKDSDIEWNNVKLERTESTEVYRVTFTKGARSVSYLANPVLEGNDYTAALAKYDAEIKAAQVNIDNAEMDRAPNEKEIAIENEKITANNEKVATQNKVTAAGNEKTKAMNDLIAIRNAAIAERNIFIEAENKRILALQKENQRRFDSIVDATNKKWEAERLKQVEAERLRVANQRRADSIADLYNSNMDMYTIESNLFRSFQIDNFGLWNCDQPVQPTEQDYRVDFRNNDNKNISIQTTKIIWASTNTITNGYNNIVRKRSTEPTLVFGVVMGNIVYNILQPNIPFATDNGSPILPMKNLELKTNSFTAIKKALLAKLGRQAR